MAMLSIVLALAAPSLSRFFRARTLDSEVRRFLALTRYGQSRAVSEGAPMVLWIDAKQGSYGLERDMGYAEGEDTNALSFTLDEKLRLEAALPVAQARARQVLSAWEPITLRAGDLPKIRFTPEGFIGPTSPERIWIHQDEKESVCVARDRTGLTYEVQTNLMPLQHR